MEEWRVIRPEAAGDFPERDILGVDSSFSTDVIRP